MKTPRQKLLEVYEKSPLPIGKLAEMLVGQDTLTDLCFDNIRVSDNELCKIWIKEIHEEERLYTNFIL
ncbi:MAG: hypothetical protein WC827_04730 [Candidatus Paceibacterota bacterium]|jgi:hypothetical protein